MTTKRTKPDLNNPTAETYWWRGVEWCLRPGSRTRYEISVWNPKRNCTMTYTYDVHCEKDFDIFLELVEHFLGGHLQAVDRVPWEIHLIPDEDAYIAALAAFNAAKV